MPNVVASIWTVSACHCSAPTAAFLPSGFMPLIADVRPATSSQSQKLSILPSGSQVQRLSFPCASDRHHSSSPFTCSLLAFPTMKQRFCTATPSGARTDTYPIPYASSNMCTDGICSLEQCCNVFCWVYACPNGYIPNYATINDEYPTSGCTKKWCRTKG